MTDAVKAQFPEQTWVVDKPIDGGCSKKRPDLFLDLGSHVVMVEIDENQHEHYEEICENKRTMVLSQDIAHRPLVVIRFNPDTYKQGETNVTSCWGVTSLGIFTIKKSKQKEWRQRLEKLYETVRVWINQVPEKTITSVYLFYDN